MLSCRTTTVRLKVALVLLATLANGIAALPTMWLQNDLIGNHFSPQHFDQAAKSRHTLHAPIAAPFPSFAFAPERHSATSSNVEQQHQQPLWWRNLLDNNGDNDNQNFNVEESRHVRSQMNEMETGPHLKGGSDYESFPLDLMMMKGPLDYSDFSQEGPELTPEDQEFLLNSLAEGMELQTNLENLLKTNRHNPRIRRSSPRTKSGVDVKAKN